MPDLYIVAGCNGAGKTTASYTILPEMLQCKEFVNADNIAAGISPFNQEKVAFEAGRIMLQRINELLSLKETFAFETTLSTKSYISLIQRAKQAGYKITLIFFWLSSPAMAETRVEKRVLNGGHNIPKDVIHRRYYRGIQNLVQLFIPVCDYWLVVDNSNEMQIVAEGEANFDSNIKNHDIWGIISNQANGY